MLVVGIISYEVPQGFYLTVESGESYKLGNLDFYRGEDIPLNSKIAIAVDEDFNVIDGEDFFYVVEPPADVANVKEKRIVVFTRRASEDSAKGFAKSIKGFWGQVSQGYWNVDAVGYQLNQDYNNCIPVASVYCKEAMHKTWAELPDEVKPDWYPSYWHIVGGSQPSACGQATLGGRYGVTHNHCGNSTALHELGHNFGLLHSNLMDDEGVAREYKDKSSVMASDTLGGLNAVNIYRLGFYGEDEVRTINTNKMFVVCPWETPKEVRQENEYPLNIIEADPHTIDRRRGSSHEKFFVSIRKDKGYPYKTSSPGTVYIHLGLVQSLLLDTIKPGQSSTAIPGVTITNVKYENEACLVVAEFDDDNSAPEADDIIPFKFPDRPTETELSEDHDGLWYNKNMVGQGFDLYIKDGKMNIYWYTHATDTNVFTSGRSWFIGTQELTEGPEVFDLIEVDLSEGGDFNNPQEGETKVMGKGQLYFYDKNNGVFNYNTERHGKGSIPISLLARTNTPRDGAYYNPDRNQEGFTFRFLDNDERCVGYWYTYTLGSNNPYIPAPPGPTWFMFDGGKQNDGSYLLNTYTVSGKFIKFDDDPRIKLLGQTKLTPGAGDTFTFESDLNKYELTSKIRKIF